MSKSPRPEPPSGSLSALNAGARLLATIECGNYGEETCRAWKLPGGAVVLDWDEKRRMVVLASDELVVTGKGFVASNMAGIESELRLIADGKDELLTHFELSLAWGGTSDEEAAAFARIVAAEAGCKLTIVPLAITDTRK